MTIEPGKLLRWAVASLFMLAATPVLAANPPTYPRLFGTHETFSADTHLFTHWMGMLERNFDEEKRGDVPCVQGASRAACAVQEWLAFIDQERGRDPMTQLKEVNAHLNLHRYVLDIINYGTENYWATPREFAIHDGDCKDYAIAKYFTLRKLGWSEADLRVVVLQDLNLNEAHAITVVYVGATAYLLDNLISEVVPAEIVHHYRPYYSINEAGWWLHTGRT